MGSYLEELAEARRQRLARMQDAAKPTDAAVKRDDVTTLSARLGAVEEQLARLKGKRSKRVVNQSVRPIVVTIQQTVCRDYATTLTDLAGPSLCPVLVEARQVAIYLCRKLAAMSYPEIARHFHRSHTAAMNACGRIDRLRMDDEKLERRLLELEQKIRSAGSSET